MTNDEKRLLYTVEQAAQQLGISRTTVYELVKTKWLYEVHIGRAGGFTNTELERFAEGLMFSRDDPRPESLVDAADVSGSERTLRSARIGGER